MRSNVPSTARPGLPLLSMLAVSLASAPLHAEWYISTVAGNGIAGVNGDGLPARRTSLYLPQDGVVGPDGYFYFCDWNNHRIRRLADDTDDGIANGTITNIAGTGRIGEALDRPALEVDFNHPTGLSFDSEGRLLIAAWHNSKVKRLDFATGFIENLAGTGARAFGGDGGPANAARLDLPSSVVEDGLGRLVISDQANFRLRRVLTDGTIETICGIGVPGFTGDDGPAAEASIRSPVGQSAPPAGRIDMDADGRIYIADTGNHAIRAIDLDGTLRTVAGSGVAGYSGDGGPATAAQLDTPSDVAVGADGTLYIADTMNNVIRTVSPGGVISTLAGTGDPGFLGDGGLAASAKLNRPYGLALAPNGDLYVSDTHNHRLRLVSETQPAPDDGDGEEPEIEIIPCTGEIGSICTYAGTGLPAFTPDGRHRLRTHLYQPIDIEFCPSGRTYVLDWNNHLVREILPDGTFITRIGTDFVGDGPDDRSDLTPAGAPGLTVNLNHPVDLQEFPDGDLMVMAWHNHKVRVLDPETGRVRIILGLTPGFAGDGGPARDARVNQPPHGVLDPSGNLFFIDQRNQRIRVALQFATMREQAIVQTIAGSGVAGFNGDGPALGVQLRLPATSNPEPSGGITIDAQGSLYFSDSLNHLIRRVDFPGGDLLQGVVTTIAGTAAPGYGGDGGPATAAAISYPEDLELGPDGRLYFADTNNHRVRRIDLTSGIIETVAGTGEEGYSGDGGPATAARLNRPFGIAFDRLGNLFVSDTFNSRIRKVTLTTDGPTAVFPADYRDTYTEVRDCRFSIEHGGVYIRVLADATALAPYLANQDPLPVGSVLVKEEYSSPDCDPANLIGWRAMRKETPGFDLEDNDWSWQHVAPDREVFRNDKATCIGCHRRDECVRRDYMCTEPSAAGAETLRPILERLPSTLLSVSGLQSESEEHEHSNAPPGIFAVGADPGDGLGPFVVGYDGDHWRRILTGATGDLWWISDRPIDGAFYLSGEDGLVLRLDSETDAVEQLETPGGPLLFGIWGADAQHIWAVGGDLADEDHGGVVWFYDGSTWTNVEEIAAARPEGIPTLYKVWGRSEREVYAAGRLGVILRFDGSTWNEVPSDSQRPLFTIHGNSRSVIASGGFVDGVILELEGTSFVDHTPTDALQLNGVFLSEDGPGAAVGIEGSFAVRSADGWRLSEPLETRGARDLHATWIDQHGGVWAVGGNLSTRLDEGVLAYAGPAAIGRQFEASGPCRSGAANEVGTVSYEQDIAPIFVRAGCTNSACHGGPDPSSEFSLLGYESTFGPGEQAEALGLCNIVPGVTRMSYLLEKLNPNPRVGARMPNGLTPLSAAEIELVRTWILEGAPRGTQNAFVRGDTTGDGRYDITDAVGIFGYLFLGTDDPPCLDAADSDDDGELAITDGIFSLNFLFLGLAQPAAPFPACGTDSTIDALDCASFASCAK